MTNHKYEVQTDSKMLDIDKATFRAQRPFTETFGIAMKALNNSLNISGFKDVENNCHDSRHFVQGDNELNDSSDNLHNIRNNCNSGAQRFAQSATYNFKVEGVDGAPAVHVRQSDKPSSQLSTSLPTFHKNTNSTRLPKNTTTTSIVHFSSPKFTSQSGSSTTNAPNICNSNNKNITQIDTNNTLPQNTSNKRSYSSTTTYSGGNRSTSSSNNNKSINNKMTSSYNSAGTRNSTKSAATMNVHGDAENYGTASPNSNSNSIITMTTDASQLIASEIPQSCTAAAFENASRGEGKNNYLEEWARVGDEASDQVVKTMGQLREQEQATIIGRTNGNNRTSSPNDSHAYDHQQYNKRANQHVQRDKSIGVYNQESEVNYTVPGATGGSCRSQSSIGSVNPPKNSNQHFFIGHQQQPNCRLELLNTKSKVAGKPIRCYSTSSSAAATHGATGSKVVKTLGYKGKGMDVDEAGKKFRKHQQRSYESIEAAKQADEPANGILDSTPYDPSEYPEPMHWTQDDKDDEQLSDDWTLGNLASKMMPSGSNCEDEKAEMFVRERNRDEHHMIMKKINEIMDLFADVECITGELDSKYLLLNNSHEQQHAPSQLTQSDNAVTRAKSSTFISLPRSIMNEDNSLKENHENDTNEGKRKEPKYSNKVSETEAKIILEKVRKHPHVSSIATEATKVAVIKKTKLSATFILDEIKIPEKTIDKFIETAKQHKKLITLMPGKVEKWSQTLQSALDYCMAGYQLETCESPRAYKLYKETMQSFVPLLNVVSGGSIEDSKSELILRCLSYLIKSILSLKLYKLRRSEIVGLQKQVDAFEKQKDSYQQNFNQLKNSTQYPIELRGSSSGCYSPEVANSPHNQYQKSNEYATSNQNDTNSRTSWQTKQQPMLVITSEAYNAISKLNYIQHFLNQSFDWWEKFVMVKNKLLLIKNSNNYNTNNNNPNNKPITNLQNGAKITKLSEEQHKPTNIQSIDVVTDILSELSYQSITINDAYKVTVAVLGLV